MASFNGIDLGFIFEMATFPNPKARQINAYCGADGLEVIDHGSRGGTTTVEGGIIGQSPTLLALAEGTFRALQQDGGAYTLVDTLGTQWDGVILTEFRPSGPIRPALGGYARRYHAEFLHV